MNQVRLSDDSHHGSFLVKPHGRTHDDDVRRLIRVGGQEIIYEKEIWLSRAQAERHVENPVEQILGMGNKVLAGLAVKNIDPISLLGTRDAMKLGLMVKEWNIADLISERSLLILTEGENALVVNKEKIAGATNPQMAAPGTIRALSGDDPATATQERRTLWTIVHVCDPSYDKFITELENLDPDAIRFLTERIMRNTGAHQHA